MLCVYRIHTGSWSRSRDLSVDIVKTKRDTGLISVENVQEIDYAESNGHVTDDVMRPWRYRFDVMQHAAGL